MKHVGQVGAYRIRARTLGRTVRFSVWDSEDFCMATFDGVTNPKRGWFQREVSVEEAAQEAVAFANKIPDVEAALDAVIKALK